MSNDQKAIEQQVKKDVIPKKIPLSLKLAASYIIFEGSIYLLWSIKNFIAPSTEPLSILGIFITPFWLLIFIPYLLGLVPILIVFFGVANVIVGIGLILRSKVAFLVSVVTVAFYLVVCFYVVPLTVIHAIVLVILLKNKSIYFREK